MRLAWPPIVIELEESVAVCAAPAPCITESAKLAGASPRFSTTMDAWPLKSRVSSATPKLKLGVPSSACAITDVWVAPTGCTSPLPRRRAEYPATLVASAVLTTASATSAALQPGCAWTTSAALPATCGVAIEVPDSKSPWLPVPTAVEKTLTPGAEMSGFR